MAMLGGSFARPHQAYNNRVLEGKRANSCEEHTAPSEMTSAEVCVQDVRTSIQATGLKTDSWRQKGLQWTQCCALSVDLKSPLWVPPKVHLQYILLSTTSSKCV